LITRPPAFSVIAIIRPSTWAGTPQSSCSGTRPIRFGQFARTMSWLPPIPPLVTITAEARNSNCPIDFRDDDTPRGSVEGSKTVPRTPVTASRSMISSSTWCRCAKRTFGWSRNRRAKISAMAGPVPQVIWNRGTELPCPCAS
jgi:hypothetical protein